MVATARNYTERKYQTTVGEGFDGVVRVSTGSFYGSGTLLYNGQAILTAAHLVQHYLPERVSVIFDTASGIQTFKVNRLAVHPNYDPINANNDLALIWLSQPAPSDANRYDIYRRSDEYGQVFNMVGYGVPGTGSHGVDDAYQGNPIRLQAFNHFEADASHLKSKLGSSMSWNPSPGTQLIADFDNGLKNNDALYQLLGLPNLGLGIYEGMITPGDSGGPAFIQGKLAGAASYVSSLSINQSSPDIDDEINSSFGEIGFWQRISAYQQWIDQSLRDVYSDAPTTAEEVKTTVNEGALGEMTTTYFFLEFTGVRDSPNQLLKVDYATRDGTATAGEDYLAVSGTLILYPGESHGVIPVEVLGDNIPEPDETFFLDVFNPVGGSFGDGIEIISAMRTIIDSDSFWL